MQLAFESALNKIDFVDFPDGGQAAFIAKSIAYIELMEKWNRVYNLTAIKDPVEMVSRHVVDSLTIAPYLKESDRILDVGTGAGLPGIPLSFVFPDKQFTLLDSNQKKQLFLQQVVQVLALKNVSLQCVRSEAYQPLAPFDVIVSRAFAPLPKMLAWTKHLLAPGGRFLAMKGKIDPEEIGSLGAGFEIEHIIALGQKDGSSQEQRHLVIVVRN